MTRWAQSRGTGSIALLRRTANYSEAGANKDPVQTWVRVAWERAVSAGGLLIGIKGAGIGYA